MKKSTRSESRKAKPGCAAAPWLGEWVSVDDGLPPEEVEVLVFGRPHGWTDPSIFMAILDCLDWKVDPINDSRNADEYLTDVTHWMRLPPAPNH